MASQTVKKRRALFLCVAALLFACSQGQIATAQDTTIQLPTFGVAIDADGVLKIKNFTERDGRLHRRRIDAAKRALPGNVRTPAKLRKISLVRLERAIQKRLEDGLKLDDVMRHLAGLQRVQYIFFFPEQKDIVIAGPAEGWVADAAGRVIGMGSRRPVINLVDLLVALRAYPPGRKNRPFIGCTIDPTPEGLNRLVAFQKTVPRTVSQRERAAVARRIGRGSRDALGNSVVRVFGVPADTRFAHVMLEADHRMKLIGIGLERPPVRMTTFLGALRSARHGTLQRWWFQPNYDCVKVTQDRLAMELVGQGVQLLSEDKAIGPGGKLLNPMARPNRASTLFTGAFTAKYPQIAAASPVYAELRNCIDMLVAAAFIQHEDYYGRAGWDMSTLSDEAAMPTRGLPTPKKVPATVNVLWKGSRLFAPAGGVSIRADEALATNRSIKDENGKLAKRYKDVDNQREANRWWWD